MSIGQAIAVVASIVAVGATALFFALKSDDSGSPASDVVGSPQDVADSPSPGASAVGGSVAGPDLSYMNLTAAIEAEMRDRGYPSSANVPHELQLEVEQRYFPFVRRTAIDIARQLASNPQSVGLGIDFRATQDSVRRFERWIQQDSNLQAFWHITGGRIRPLHDQEADEFGHLRFRQDVASALKEIEADANWEQHWD